MFLWLRWTYHLSFLFTCLICILARTWKNLIEHELEHDSTQLIFACNLWFVNQVQPCSNSRLVTTSMIRCQSSNANEWQQPSFDDRILDAVDDAHRSNIVGGRQGPDLQLEILAFKCLFGFVDCPFEWWFDFLIGNRWHHPSKTGAHRVHVSQAISIHNQVESASQWMGWIQDEMSVDSCCNARGAATYIRSTIYVSGSLCCCVTSRCQELFSWHQRLRKCLVYFYTYSTYSQIKYDTALQHHSHINIAHCFDLYGFLCDRDMRNKKQIYAEDGGLKVCR